MFERLTRWENNDKDVADLIEEKSDFDGLTEAINRLAAYEDSGLSPEEVQELVKVLKQARESLKAAWEDDGSTTVGKQMLEIIKAIDALMGGMESEAETSDI